MQMHNNTQNLKHSRSQMNIPNALSAEKLFDLRSLSNSSAQHIGNITINPLLPPRKINEVGLQMLQKSYHLREKEIKAQILENRLKRLEHEEERAEKLRKKAEEKAELMMNARQRHHNALIEKLKAYEEQTKWIEY